MCLNSFNLEMEVDSGVTFSVIGENQVISDAASGKEQFPSLCQEEPGKLEGFEAHVDHGNADCMSRLPAPGLLEESPVPADAVLTLEHLETTPIISAMVREWTCKDSVLAQVVRLLEEGWPDIVKSEELLPY